MEVRVRLDPLLYGYTFAPGFALAGLLLSPA